MTRATRWPRVYAVDDHTGDNIDVADDKAFGMTLDVAWATSGAALNAWEKQGAILKRAPDFPQIWVAGWEIRNLRMVANIRETFRERPGRARSCHCRRLT